MGICQYFPVAFVWLLEKKQLMFLNQFNRSLKKEIMPIENTFSKLPNAKIPLFSWCSVSVLGAIGGYRFWQQAVADRDMLILILPVSSLPSNPQEEYNTSRNRGITPWWHSPIQLGFQCCPKSVILDKLLTSLSLSFIFVKKKKKNLSILQNRHLMRDIMRIMSGILGELNDVN